jgi:hypothetical protein
MGVSRINSQLQVLSTFGEHGCDPVYVKSLLRFVSLSIEFLFLEPLASIHSRPKLATLPLCIVAKNILLCGCCDCGVLTYSASSQEAEITLIQTDTYQLPKDQNP